MNNYGDNFPSYPKRIFADEVTVFKKARLNGTTSLVYDADLSIFQEDTSLPATVVSSTSLAGLAGLTGNLETRLSGVPAPGVITAIQAAVTTLEGEITTIDSTLAAA